MRASVLMTTAIMRLAPTNKNPEPRTSRWGDDTYCTTAPGLDVLRSIWTEDMTGRRARQPTQAHNSERPQCQPEQHDQRRRH